MNSFKYARGIVALSSFVSIALSVYGGYALFSHALFWDMLHGYLGVFEAVSRGDHSIWWAQHNEHRIFISRLLFWMDLSWFSGSLVFLAVLNYALVIFAWALACCALKERIKAFPHTRPLWAMCIMVMASWLFSWSQHENLLWAFQSQFFLAQSLPLAALLSLYKAHDSNRNLWFLAACFFGFCSAATMANGVLALPLMVFLALIVGMRKPWVVVLCALTALELWLYFSGYHSIPGHGSLSQALREQPIELLLYVFVYLGNPFAWMARNQPGIGALAGAVMVTSAVWMVFSVLRRRKSAALELSLLCFLLYIGGTALGTGGGRLIFGVDQALASRYATPALLAWAAWFVLAYPVLVRWGVNVARNLLVLASVLLCLLNVPKILFQLEWAPAINVQRSAAMLALELGVPDEKIIKTVIFSSEAGLSGSRYAVEHNVSVFGRPPVRDLRERIGTTLPPADAPPTHCFAHLDKAETIEGVPTYRRIRGWAFDPADSSKTQGWLVLDTQDRVVGAVLSGSPRPDVAQALNRSAGRAGFLGYAGTESMQGKVSLVNSATGCRVSLAVP